MEPYRFINLDGSMEKLKVLFLTYAYPPQKYPRSVQISHLVQYLRKEFSLKVITSSAEDAGDQSLLSFTPLDNVQYAEKSAITQFIEKSRGHRIKKSTLPDFQYFWHFDLYKKTSLIIDEFGADVIVTFGQPMSTHITGLKLKKKYLHLKWVAHFSDPWVDNVFNDHNSWVRFVNKHSQDTVFNIADQLIFTSEETIDLVTRSYSSLIRSKALYIPHSFDESLYSIQENTHQTANPLIIRYLGNFYGNRQPDYLFEAFKNIQKSDLENIRVEFVGSATDAIEDKIIKYGLEETVFLRSSVSYLDSLSLMQESDLLLIIDAPAELSPFLPSKLVDYIGANKPIFGITPPGTSQKLIEEMGFLVAHPNNPAEIAEKLLLVMQQLKDKKLSTIPDHIRSRYSIAVVGKQMANVLC